MRKNNFILTSAVSLTAVAGAIGLASGANAQQASSSATIEDAAEIIVTATRRDQALQDIPLAVTAVGGEQIKQQNITSTADLMRVAPTLQVQTGQNETNASTFRIRGVGTTGDNFGLEGAVGIFIDGVYRQRAGLAMNNLFDIGHVEVLRGPQGTLFGKNTSAGAITIQPNLPKLGAFDGSVRLTAGNYSAREVEGMVNVPLGEKVAVRVSGAYQKRDGYIRDVITGADTNDRDRKLVRAQILFEPSDTVSWRGVFDYSEKDEHCCQAVYGRVGGATLLMNSLVPGAVSPIAPTYLSIGTPSRPFVEKTDDTGFASYLTIELPNDITFKNILAHREFNGQNNGDADFGAADILYQHVRSRQKLTSAEATFSGKWGVLDWLVGGYFSDESVDVNSDLPYGTQFARYIGTALGGSPAALALANAAFPAGGGAQKAVFAQDSTSWSFFTHNQIQITEQLGAVVGVRYNHEKKKGGLSEYITNSPSCGGGPYDGQGAAPLPGLPNSVRLLCPRPTFSTKVNESRVTGTAGLNWRFTRDILAYASYTHGYKAGGINLNRDASVAAAGTNPATGLVRGTPAQVAAAARFKPETSDSYEVGVRSQFFGRTLTINATYFNTKFKDFQLNTFNGFGFLISNPGSVTTRGIEVEGSWRPIRDLSFTYGVTRMSAKYGNDAGLRAPVAASAPPPFPANPPLAGRTINGAPRWSASWGVHFEQPVTGSGEVKAFIDLSANYRSRMNVQTNLNPLGISPSLTLINGRIGIHSDSEHGWEVALFGTNLTKKFYQVFSSDAVVQAGSISAFPGAPRMYGISVRKDF
ncbi:TonB-dependent receptor [Rhizorhabdus sp.]|jgi:outer membrane receptor protein involved in Fe transport|uniref:TonB-dependent receptor n=1 Tax=Rhizorhabdus sp. TaxID=1968843 RepID=UPI0019943C0C|nr:TonB-dependent receptor [Rhizorhabdus sp.]MBD3759249.1 TonB-dependent receptor [Rhizorhabdus sp.]